MISKIIKSNLIILIFSLASSALSAVVIKYLFSFKYFLTKVILFLHHHQQPVYVLKNHPFIILLKTLSKLITSSDLEFSNAL